MKYKQEQTEAVNEHHTNTTINQFSEIMSRARPVEDGVDIKADLANHDVLKKDHKKICWLHVAVTSLYRYHHR